MTVLLAAPPAVFGQPESGRRGPATSIYLDLLGPGLLYSVGLEYLGGPDGRFGARLGFSTFEIGFLTEHRAVIVPLSFLHVRRRRAVALEMGGGPIFAGVGEKGDGEFGTGGLIGHVLLGGRFNDRVGSRIVVRLNGMLAFSRDGVLPWPGLGFNVRL